MADKQADQDHTAGACQHGEHPSDRHARCRAGQLGHQCGRAHQQDDPGRLDENEVAVGQDALDEMDCAAEIGPVVIFGKPQQVSGQAELVCPQAKRQYRRCRDDDGHRVAPGGGQTRAGQ